MGMTFRYRESTLSSGLDRMAEKAGAVILRYAVDKKAPEIDGWMKSLPYHGDPWHEQTGHAKKEFNVRVSNPKPNIVRITLAHGVHYGIWLELKHEKQNAVIPRIINKFGPEIVEDLQGIFDNFGKVK